MAAPPAQLKIFFSKTNIPPPPHDLTTTRALGASTLSCPRVVSLHSISASLRASLNELLASRRVAAIVAAMQNANQSGSWRAMIPNKERVPQDLRRAMDLLELKELDDLEQNFLARLEFLRPWSVFRDTYFLVEPDGVSSKSRARNIKGMDLMKFYTYYDDGKLRYDPRGDSKSPEFNPNIVPGEIDKSRWGPEEHEKLLYAWLLQEFKVGKTKNPFGFEYFKLRSVHTAWEQVFIPIVETVRNSYSARGRRYYGRLALFIEDKSPSRLAFPDANVNKQGGSGGGGLTQEVQTPTPFRLVSRPKEPDNGNNVQDELLNKSEVLAPKQHQQVEDELRETYKYHGGHAEKPKAQRKDWMSAWLKEQRERQQKRKSVLSVEDEKKKPQPKTLTNLRSPDWASSSGYADSIASTPPQRSQTVSVASQKGRISVSSEKAEVKETPKSPKSPTSKSPKPRMVPYGMYGMVPRAPSPPKSPVIHGLTADDYVPQAQPPRPRSPTQKVKPNPAKQLKQYMNSAEESDFDLSSLEIPWSPAEQQADADDDARRIEERDAMMFGYTEPEQPQLQLTEDVYTPRQKTVRQDLLERDDMSLYRQIRNSNPWTDNTQVFGPSTTTEKQQSPETGAFTTSPRMDALVDSSAQAPSSKWDAKKPAAPEYPPFSPYGPPSAIPKGLSLEKPRSPYEESPSARVKKMVSDLRNPSYEGTAYDRATSPFSPQPSRGVPARGGGGGEPGEQKPASQLPRPVQKTPHSTPGSREVSGESTKQTTATSRSASRQASGNDDNVPQSIPWPGQRESIIPRRVVSPDSSSRNAPKAVPWPGQQDSPLSPASGASQRPSRDSPFAVSAAAAAAAGVVGEEEDFGPPPPIPPKNPARLTSPRGHLNHPRSRQLIHEESQTRLAARIVSKENIRAALAGSSEESLADVKKKDGEEGFGRRAGGTGSSGAGSAGAGSAGAGSAGAGSTGNVPAGALPTSGQVYRERTGSGQHSRKDSKGKGKQKMEEEHELEDIYEKKNWI